MTSTLNDHYASTSASVQAYLTELVKNQWNSDDPVSLLIHNHDAILTLDPSEDEAVKRAYVRGLVKEVMLMDLEDDSSTLSILGTGVKGFPDPHAPLRAACDELSVDLNALWREATAESAHV